MKNPRDIIIKPVITERSMADAEEKNSPLKWIKERIKLKLKMPLKSYLVLKLKK